jgi:hypothetical protein
MMLIGERVTFYKLFYTSLNDQSCKESTEVLVQQGHIPCLHPQQKSVVAETAFRQTSRLNTHHLMNIYFGLSLLYRIKYGIYDFSFKSIYELRAKKNNERRTYS